MEKICGYLILRKPEYHTDSAQIKNYVTKKETVDAIDCYRGIDRMPWEEIEVDYYNNTLPERILNLWNNLRVEKKDYTGIYLSKDFGETLELLEYSNSKNKMNEICVIYSKKLENIRGSISVDKEIEWFGYDIMSIGNWSLITGGILKNDDYYTMWKNRLTMHSLIIAPNYLDELLSDYRMWSKNNVLIEPLTEGVYGFDNVAIGKLKTKND